ncbi:hypothetical protein GCM10027029_08630 [Conyzicola lurida]
MPRVCHLSRSAIPKSTKAARIAENFDIFGFGLSADQLPAIVALDTGVRGGTPVEAITREAFAFEIPEAGSRVHANLGLIDQGVGSVFIALARSGRTAVARAEASRASFSSLSDRASGW